MPSTDLCTTVARRCVQGGRQTHHPVAGCQGSCGALSPRARYHGGMPAGGSGAASVAPASQCVSGGLVLNTRGFVCSRAGEDGWREVLRRLHDGYGEQLDHALAVGWYSCDAYDQLNDATAALLADEHGREKLLLQLGRYTAEQDFRAVHRLFLKMVTPATVFDRLPKIWPRYQNGGAWEVQQHGEREWLGTQHDCEVSSESTCIRLQGFVQRVGEMTGCTRLTVDRPTCTLRGDNHCQLRARWR